MGTVDVLLMPAGGFFTLEPTDLDKLIEKIKPKIVIPMHYKTEKAQLPFSDIEGFIKNKADVEKPGKSEITINTEKLPASTKIVVLNHAN
jgi:L-ascorbate metabolism protein UlaG (beta-lactamase superfamily)